jgi:AmmeMemoRadiSam system protein B
MTDTLTTAPRPAAQANRFYSGDADQLRREIHDLLAAAPAPRLTHLPFGLMVPHAGYAYSGATAAAAYRAVGGMTFDRVLVLAPAHTMPVRGIALPPHAAFETPLGRVPVDQCAVTCLACERPIGIEAPPHAREHAIEVELPFLQVALAGPFKIVPMVIGDLDPSEFDAVARRINAMIQPSQQLGRRWLVVASSDTYHGKDRAECKANDRELTELLEHFNSGALELAFRRGLVTACGWKGLALALRVTREMGARRGMVLDRRDSADAGGGKDGGYVVGYIGAAFV